MGTLLSTHDITFADTLRGDVFTGSVPSRESPVP